MDRHPRSYLLGIVILLFVGFTTGCGEQQQSPVGLAAGELSENIERYQDSLVTVSGEVNSIYAPNVFTVGGSGFQSELLVISADPIGIAPGRTEERPVREQDLVQVTGIAERFEESELENTYDIELSDELAEEFQGNPTLVAASGTAVLSEVIVSPRTGPLRDVPMQAEPITSLEEIASASNPEEYAERMAVFSNAEIEQSLGNNAFWISTGGDERLFVTLPEPAIQQEPTEGERWSIYGMIRRAPTTAELTDTWGLSDSTAAELASDEIYLYGIQAQPAGS